MPNINCPLCGAALNLPESAAGKDVACGICQGRFNAPLLPAGQSTATPGATGGAPDSGGFQPFPQTPSPEYASYPPPIPVQLPTSGFAIASLVLGISAFPVCGCYGLPAIVCGILAIVFAAKARQAVEAGIAAPSSLGLAKAGQICGIIALIVAVLAWTGIIAWYIWLFNEIGRTGRF